MLLRESFRRFNYRMHRVAPKSLRRSNLMSCQFMNIVPVH